METNKEPTFWLKSFMFPKIFQAFRIAVHPKNLILAFFAVAVIFLAGWLMDLKGTVASYDDTTELDVFLETPSQVSAFIEGNTNKSYTGVFATLLYFGAEKLNSAVYAIFELNCDQVWRDLLDWGKAVKWALTYHTIYFAIFALIKLSILAVAGGAICRIASFQFSKGEKPGLCESLQFSTKKFTSFFAAPLLPLMIIIILGILIAILGLIANIPYAGELIMGLFLPLALLAGGVCVVIAIGAAGGYGLMYPAIAYEGSDSFDAISRSLSYLYASPWRMIFYSAIALVYGTICTLFVKFFAFLLLLLTRMFLQAAVFSSNSSENANKLKTIWPVSEREILDFSRWPQGTNWTEAISTFLVSLNIWIITVLIISFALSFYFCANTIIYAMMRNKVDGTELSDIYTDLEESGTLDAKEGAK